MDNNQESLELTPPSSPRYLQSTGEHSGNQHNAYGAQTRDAVHQDVHRVVSPVIKISRVYLLDVRCLRNLIICVKKFIM